MQATKIPSPTTRSVLDCNCGKKNCPRFEASDEGVLALDGPNLIAITPEQATMLRQWLQANGY